LITGIQHILTEVGRLDIWHNQENLQNRSILGIIKQILIDQNLQNWHNTLQESTKGKNYSIYKENIKLEEYLLKVKKPDYTRCNKIGARTLIVWYVQV
jgi:hypothetical protein